MASDQQELRKVHVTKTSRRERVGIRFEKAMRMGVCHWEYALLLHTYLGSDKHFREAGLEAGRIETIKNLH